jgi:signal transduction histidine kinase
VPSEPPWRAVTWALAAGLLAVAGTAAVVAADVTFVSAAGRGQLALDTVASAVALLLGFLVYGRFHETRLHRDALLCAALLVLGSGNALLSVLPSVTDASGRLTTAAAFAGLWAGVLIAVAGWVRPLVVDVARARWMPLQLALLTAMVLVASWGMGELLPREQPGSVDTFGTGEDELLVAAQMLAALAFLVSAAGWCRPAVQGDRIAAPLAGAAVLSALSRLDFAVASDPDSAWVTAATLLRLAFYGMLVTAIVVEIRSYWRRVAQVAVLEERRRIARDLHDGLAQELAFAATQARALADRSEQPTRARLVAAATERALDESRRAIAALTRPLDEPIEASLAQCAEEVCSRFDAQLLLEVEPGLSVVADTREALLRILREAVTNALRHGQARTVAVRLHGPDPVRLVVQDDGVGFDASDLRHLSGRFGLISMRERAEALGGAFRLASAPAGGTTVEVELP